MCNVSDLFVTKRSLAGGGAGGLEPPQKFSDLNFCYKSGILLPK